MKLKPYCVEDIGTSEVVSIFAESSLVDCARKMHDLHVSSLIVVEPLGENLICEPIGILTALDIVWEAVAFSLDLAVITAGDIMTGPVETARLDEPLQLVHRRMVISDISSIVIVDNLGAIVGRLEADKVCEVLLGTDTDFGSSK
jgi:CBS domain-containing protein